MNETQDTTTLVTHARPEISAIEWNGQQYVDSYDYHQQYLSDGDPKKAKHKEHRNFRAVIRSIESYSIYVNHRNIVILSWEQVKLGPAEIFSRLQPYFARRGYRDLILLDATAQAALTHHLDNELSRQMSVAINTAAARELTGQGRLPAELAKRTYRAMLDIGKMMGVSEHIVQEFAVKQVLLDTGLDLQPLLSNAPAMNEVHVEDVMLEPENLAKKLGVRSGILMNKLLAQIGWQHKPNPNSEWKLTKAGERYAVLHPWMRNGKSGYNYKWNVEAVRHELQRLGILPGDAA